MKWFRPCLASLLVISAIAAFFMDKIGSEAFMALVTGLAVWWFKSRDDTKNKGA
ncbi:MAG: hypothetical protein Q8P44_07460 [Dehalococcoidia bacterium]|nr:hypothetical protein [Dehalococcoidia bacterium]